MKLQIIKEVLKCTEAKGPLQGLMTVPDKFTIAFDCKHLLLLPSSTIHLYLQIPSVKVIISVSHKIRGSVVQPSISNI